MFNLNIVYLIGEKTIEDVHFSMFNLNTVYLISEKTGLRMFIFHIRFSVSNQKLWTSLDKR